MVWQLCADMAWKLAWLFEMRRAGSQDARERSTVYGEDKLSYRFGFREAKAFFITPNTHIQTP